MLVTSPANVRYLSGFTGSNGWLLVGGDRTVLVTDPRYEIQAHTQVDCDVWVTRSKLVGTLAKLVRKWGWRRIGFETAHLRHEAYAGLSETAQSGVEWVPLKGWVERLRACKSQWEIERVRQAAATAAQAFDAIVPLLKPGLTEREVATELDYRLRRLGADRAAFETIVATGPNSALPHAQPTDRQLQAGEPVLLDFGAQRHGYASDMTRTVHLGAAPASFRRLYAAVLEAQQAALEAVRAGVTSADVDEAARAVLSRHKLESLFVHATGHGVGIEVHELPRLGKGERARLREGMVVTIEPGIYVEGYCGIRIEDTVLVTQQGCEVLTQAPKNLLEL